jgi:serine/threonine protein kinase
LLCYWLDILQPSSHGFASEGIYEFADGGSLEDLILDKDGEVREEFESWTSTYKLSLAYQVARGIADIHNIDQEGRASMSHTDIAARQFISVDGGKSFKINDFNRARFLYRNITHPELNCPFYVGSNTGRFRAPEEYARGPETEKIDVYSMGNIFYQILTGLYPFEDWHRKDMYAAIQKGIRPPIPEKYLNSTDPKEQAMVEAIQTSWIGDPAKRISARKVEQLLKRTLQSS